MPEYVRLCRDQVETIRVTLRTKNFNQETIRTTIVCKLAHMTETAELWATSHGGIHVTFVKVEAF